MNAQSGIHADAEAPLDLGPTDSSNEVSVLIVDDQPANLLALESLLIGMGLTVVKAFSGREALRCVLERDYAVILLDVQMPGMDGFETATLIRLRERSQRTPIIFVTAYVSRQEQVFRGYEVGAVDYLYKPLVPETLKSKVAVFVDLFKKTQHLRHLNETLEQRVAERTAALKSAEEKYRSIFENAVMGIFQTTPEGEHLTANPALARMYGYDSPENLITSVRDISRTLYVDPNRRVEFKRALKESDAVFNFESQVYRVDGGIIWTSVNARAVRDDGGKLLYYEGTTEDITSRKQAEDDLRESNRRLEEALNELQRAQSKIIAQERLRALGTMASGIAHDFNNALGPIVGFSELLLTRPENLDDREKTLRYLQLMNTGAKDAARTVSRLREFYRKREEGDAFLPVDLSQIADQAIALTQPKWKDQAQAKGVAVAIAPELNKVPMVSGDPAELRELLTNLIFNAVDAMLQGGTVTIRTRTEERTNGRVEERKNGGDDPSTRPLVHSSTHVLLEVQDTGTGMTDEVRAKCMEPFFSTKGDHGTGLGLGMVAGIVERHEARIDIQSELGKGTTFIIRFPVAEQATLRAAEIDAPTTRSLRALVVDDEPLLRETMRLFLEDWGHTVVTAAHGREAAELFGPHEFDVVLTDRAMPEMNGDQLAEFIAQHRPGTPVIMVTGFGEMMQHVGECPPGVTTVVGKPVTAAALRKVLAEVMKQQRLSAD